MQLIVRRLKRGGVSLRAVCPPAEEGTGKDAAEGRVHASTVRC